jgi:hypothetical protein
MNIGTIGAKKKNQHIKSKDTSTKSKSESPKKEIRKPKDKGDSVKLSTESKESKSKDGDKRVGSILGGLAESLGGIGKEDGKTDKTDKTGESGKTDKPDKKDKTDKPNKEPDLSEANIEARSDLANESNDPTVLNEIDSFRAQLPPDQQKKYDEQLADLREDERIRFVEHDGAKADLATRDFALRGILTATYGNPEDLEKTLNTAAHSGHKDGKLVEKEDGDGHLDIHLYDGELPIRPIDDPDGEQFEAAVVTSGGDIHANTDFLRGTLKNGENLFTHEFTHSIQGSQSNGKWKGGQDFPQDFPDDLKDRFEDEFKSDKFQKYFKEIGLNNDFGGESLPGVQTVFRYYPDELKENSPELYKILTSYNGYDPLKGENVERQVKPPGQDDDSFFDKAKDVAGTVIDTFNPF